MEKEEYYYFCCHKVLTFKNDEAQICPTCGRAYIRTKNSATEKPLQIKRKTKYETMNEKF